MKKKKKKKNWWNYINSGFTICTFLLRALQQLYGKDELRHVARKGKYEMYKAYEKKTAFLKERNKGKYDKAGGWKNIMLRFRLHSTSFE